MTVEACSVSLTESSDEALIAELTPEMRKKLKADSRHQALSRGFYWTVAGAFMIPTLAKLLGLPGSFDLPSRELIDWLGLLCLLSMMGSIVCGAVTMARGFIGQPSMLRDELRYRRRHGKWRWEH